MRSCSFFRSSAARAVLATVLASAVAAPALAAEADAAGDTGSGLEEIVVTAQKRSENLQDTPIAISVISGEALKERAGVSLLDLGDGAIPSLKVAPFFSRPGALIVNVRGVGVLSDSNQPARDQGVGVYIDGIYLGRAQGLGTALFDVENIEVLKGPQGTLFGRNTMGGAVSIVTKKPSGEFKLNTTVGVGNYGSHRAEVHLDLPEYQNISIKIDGVLAKRDPFVRNPLSGSIGYNSFDKNGVAVSALWKPSSNFSALATYDTSYDATSTLYMQLIEAPKGLPATASGAAAILPNRLAAIAKVQPDRVDVAAYGTPQQPSIGKTWGTRLGLEWEVAPQITLKSISSYRDMSQGQFDNGNAVPSTSLAPTASNPTASFLLPSPFQFGRYSLAQFKQDQQSQEVQLIGTIDRVKFVAGGLFYREHVEDSAQAPNTLQMTDEAGSAFVVRSIDITNGAAGQPAVIQRASRVTTKSVGVFGQATWTPPVGGDMIHLTAGLRWTRDQKNGELFTINGLAPTIPVNGVNVTGPIALDASWSRLDPMVNLSVDLTDGIMAYGKWSTGYRSGGASSRSLSYRKFNPESVSMFEIGAKTEFWDRKARLNVAGYYGDYKDIQLDFSGLYEDIVNGVRVATTRTTTDVVNAPGTGKLKGLEAELTLAPAQGLTLFGSFAWNSVKIPDTVNPFPQTGGVLITRPIPIYQVYTPKYSASGAIDYAVPLNDLTAKFHLDVNYDAGYYINYTDVEFDPVSRAVRYTQPKGDKAFIVNARVSLADIKLGSDDKQMTLSIWSRNLLNEQHVFYKSASARAGVSGFFNDPRTFGFDINIKM